MKIIDKPEILYGELSTPRKNQNQGTSAHFSGHAVDHAISFNTRIVIDCAQLYHPGGHTERSNGSFTLENYKRLAGYSLFGWTPDYLKGNDLKNDVITATG